MTFVSRSRKDSPVQVLSFHTLRTLNPLRYEAELVLNEETVPIPIIVKHDESTIWYTVHVNIRCDPEFDRTKVKQYKECLAGLYHNLGYRHARVHFPSFWFAFQQLIVAGRCVLRDATGTGPFPYVKVLTD